MICNAHLDPVWLWQWPDGVAETISTFRTAVELAEKDSAFVFNHNEAILYKWVQQYAPSLFERIQKLVKKRKWHIMGGWYLQPDCNMPSGESFVRHILIGKEYFKANFDIEPKTAINFDPFGHTRGLVQILIKSGYDSYLFGRPESQFLDLPGADFSWVGFNNSKITASRFSGWYNTPLGRAAEKLTEKMEDAPDKPVLVLLWGVGNHGGGPSKKDLADVNRLIAQSHDKIIKHSTPENYFKELKRISPKLPEYKKDLNPWATGCYSSQIRIKQKHRQLENEIYSLEKMAAAAHFQNLVEYPTRQINEALDDLLFSQFHDILPGSAVESVESDSLRTIDHGLEIASRLKTRAFIALAEGQKNPKANQIPILVYNHHPFKTNQLVQCEFNKPGIPDEDTFADVQVYQNGKLIPSQIEKESSNLPDDWHKKIVFMANLAPGQMNRFDCKLIETNNKPEHKIIFKKNVINFKTKQLNVTINSATGLIDRYRANGKDILEKDAFCPVVIADIADCWGMTLRSYKKRAGKFTLMPKKTGSLFSGITEKQINSVRVIEDGPVRMVVEAVLHYNNSQLCIRYKLPKSGTQIEVQLKLYWNEKDKMLKLAVPTRLTRCEYIGQTAYGIHQLPNDGREAVAQKWTAASSKKDNLMLTCINDGIYSSSFSNDTLYLTLLRSPAYSTPSDEKAHVKLVQDRFIPRIDQGQFAFRFWFDADTILRRKRQIDREALVKNEQPFTLSFSPKNTGRKTKPLAVLDDDVIQITAMKKAQKNNDLIVRLFEPSGRKRSAVLLLPLINKRIKIELEAFEIKSLRVNLKTKKITEVDLLEKRLKKQHG